MACYFCRLLGDQPLARRGCCGGYFTTFGLVLGIWTQVIVVGVGLGAVVATSSTAFLVIKWLGVSYLVWLGIAQWRAPAVPLVARTDDGTVVTRRSMVLRAWMINAVKPKGTVILFCWRSSSAQVNCADRP